MDPSALGGRAGIAKVRVRGASGDALSARRRIERLLGAADPGDAGLPPGAIAIVRRLADPSPGTLPLDRDEARPPPGWERAFAAQVRSAVGRGAWPARGPVSPDAPAVVFASAAEMWSCLALDLARGVAGLFWWWQGMARPGPLRAQLVARWLEQPELAPLALHRAAQAAVAKEVLSLLDVAQARVLAVRICERFALPRLAAAVEDPERSARGSVQPPAGATAPLFAGVAPEVLQVQAGAAPRALLAVALLVHRAPALARREEMPAQLAHWLREPPAAPSGEAAAPAPEERPEPAPAASPQARAAEVRAAFEVRSPAHEEEADSEAPPAPAPALPSDIRAGVAPPIARPIDLPEPPPVRVAGPAREGANPPQPRSVRTRERDAQPDPRPAVAKAEAHPAPETCASPAHVPAPDPAPAPPETVRTSLGGAFYLLRLALWLELYGDFTRPRAPCLPLSPWDFVALLADGLLGGADGDDSLWPLLAELADRPQGVPPGSEFRTPDEYRVPLTWLAPFGQPLLAWDVSGGRLRLAHPAGFLALDAPARVEIDGRSQAAAGAASLGLALGERRRIADPGGDGAQWYFARLTPYADARLRAGLGLRPEDDLPGTLLRHEARVHLAAGRVDVTFALAALPLRVRFAGLDQDVGWLPAAARSIAFHFE